MRLGSANRRNWREILAPALFVIALGVITAKQRFGTVYGLAPAVPAADVVRLVSAVAPTLFFLCTIIREMLIAGGGLDDHDRRKAALAVPTAATAATLAVVLVDVPAAVRGLVDGNLLYAALGWEADFILIYGFGYLIGIVARRPVYIALVAIAYSVAAIAIGSALKILPFVGFDTTPLITISRFSALPPEGFAPWIWRLYWALILIALLLARWHRRQGEAGLDRTRPGHGGPLRVAFAIGALSAAVALAIMLGRDERQLAATYPDILGALPAPFGGLTIRPRVTQFAIAVDGRDPADLALRGRIRLINASSQPIANILFEHAQMMTTTDVESSRAARIWQSPDRRLIGVQLAFALRPGDRLEIDYRGHIAPRNALDTIVRSRLLSRGFFLQTPTLIPLPRVSACVLAQTTGRPCATDENYLLGDAARGAVSVMTPPNWTVAKATKVAEIPRGWLFRMEATGREGANLLIAAARYVRRPKVVTACGEVEVDAMSLNAEAVGALAREVCAAQIHYRRLFGPGGGERDFGIVEVPNAITEATTFPGAVALSERVLASTHNGQISPLLRFILWHETAHLWWGYGIVPRQDTGLGFALESVPQFLALKNAAATGDATKIRGDLLAQQSRALRRERGAVKPIWAAEPDWRAYVCAPLAFTALDRSGGMEARLALAYRTLAGRGQYYNGHDLARALTIADGSACAANPVRTLLDHAAIAPSRQ